MMIIEVSETRGKNSGIGFFLAKQPLKQLLASELKMCGHIGENGWRGTDAKRRMLRYCEMMLVLLIGDESKMATGLASDRVTELAKSLREVIPRQMVGKPHTAITSSRT